LPDLIRGKADGRAVLDEVRGREGEAGGNGFKRLALAGEGFGVEFGKGIGGGCAFTPFLSILFPSLLRHLAVSCLAGG
jgi:hypothetical protein